MIKPSTYFIWIPNFGIIPSRSVTMYQELLEQALLRTKHCEICLRSVTIASLLLLRRNGRNSSLVWGKFSTYNFTSSQIHVVIVRIARKIIPSQLVETKPKKVSILKKAMLLLSLRPSKGWPMSATSANSTIAMGYNVARVLLKFVTAVMRWQRAIITHNKAARACQPAVKTMSQSCSSCYMTMSSHIPNKGALDKHQDNQCHLKKRVKIVSLYGVEGKLDEAVSARRVLASTISDHTSWLTTMSQNIKLIDD